MSFPQYPKYKPSGVEWLGDVPEHWTSIRYKNIFFEKIRKNGAYLPAGAISFGTVVFKSEESFNEDTKATYQEVLQGEFLINPINLNYDLKSLRTALSAIDTCVSPAYIVLQAQIEIDATYLKYQLFLFDIRHMKTLGAGVRQTITFADIGSCFTQLPPLAEQTQIAGFLDRETGKIDELVAEQRRLIALLKEKRQAVISHAVTKGLNPNAPTKPSNIQWLGNIPEHWEVRRMKFLCDIQTGDKDTENAVDDGQYPFFVRSQTVERIDSMAFNCEAVLTAGDGAGVGKVFHYYEGPFDFHQRVYMMNRFRKITGKFLFHFLRENFFKVVLEGGAKSTVDSLRRPMFANFPICVPPLAEQCEIIERIESDAANVDALTAEAERAIELLQERRTALISSAVTGKIDVRDADASAA